MRASRNLHASRTSSVVSLMPPVLRSCNTGIGYDAAGKLAARGYDVIMARLLHQRFR